MRGGVKLRKRDLLIIPVIIGVCMFSHVEEEPKVQANPINDYIPYYATEEYQRIKQAEQEKQEQEALMLRASIEEYQERQQEESERLFREHAEELVKNEDDEDLLFLANCVEAEAGNQDDLGKRLVCDVILNRVDDPDFPDTIREVITQKYHFTSYWDGGMDRWKPTEDTIEICREELESRQYTGLIYFTAGNYNPYGTPAFKHGDHYFSTK